MWLYRGRGALQKGGLFIKRGAARVCSLYVLIQTGDLRMKRGV